MLAIVTAILYWILITGLESDESRLVLSKVKNFEATLRVNGDNMAILENEVNLEGGAHWPGQHYVVYSRILDEVGHTIIEAPGMEEEIPQSVFPPPTAIEQSDGHEAVRYQKAPNGRSFFLMSGLARSGGEDGPQRVIQVAMDQTGERAAISVYRRNTLIALAVATLLFVLVGIIVTRRCLQPLHDLARHAERITANNVLSDVDPDTSRWPKELATVADSYYRMLARIDASFKWCSQCTEDMAHELRGPINCLMGEAEVALSKDRTTVEYRRVLESSLEEYTQLSRLIKELLFVSRADNPNNAIKRTRMDARSEVETVREFYDGQAQDQGIEIRCTGSANIEADPLLFRRAVSNLVSNALSHTKEGGMINIAVRNAESDDMVEIAVHDTGCGIDAEDLPRIFDRFYRIELKKQGKTEGAGLGLAIVKSIMTLHGGSVALGSIEGKGTTAKLRFPAVAGRVEDSAAAISDIAYTEAT